MEKKRYSISEISKIYHIGLDSIRYYEKIGLINPKRTKNNYRYYDGDDIYKLNIIRELLELGFTSKDISLYFNDRSVKTTYELLRKEKEQINKTMANLKLLKDNVNMRLKEIRQIENIEFEIVKEKQYEKRHYSLINKGYSKSSDMDILIQQLSNKDKDDFYIIGNNHIGTFIPSSSFINDDKLEYKGVFVISKSGKNILEKGKYLSILYQGDYNKSKDCLIKLKEYALNHHLEIISDFLEIIWIDIHSTDKSYEYVTEVQVLVK